MGQKHWKSVPLVLPVLHGTQTVANISNYIKHGTQATHYRLRQCLSKKKLPVTGIAYYTGAPEVIFVGETNVTHDASSLHLRASVKVQFSFTVHNSSPRKLLNHSKRFGWCTLT